MPQMMPINWIMSLLFFICVFMMFNILNYYIFINNFNKSNNSNFHKKNNMIWKW